MQPVYSEVASKGLTSTKNTGFLTPNGDICRLFAVFYLGMLEDSPPESLEDPSETPPADIIKGREFDFDSIDRDRSKPPPRVL